MSKKQKKLSILLVEDNGMFLNIAEEMLSEHNVIPVRTAKDAISQYNKNKPDVTFLDISLPDGNGHDVLKKIKKSDNQAYVVMLTASRLKEDVLQSMSEGAEGYIIKPFSDSMIHECIKEYYEFKENKKSDK